MKIFHTSPTKIDKINKLGIAGDCLFFSDNVYQMAACEVLVYSLDLDDDKVIRASQLYDTEIIAEIAELYDCNEDEAETLLDASGSEWDHDNDAEKSWRLQGLRGKCAKVMGYEACEDEDEQGTVYIVPMLDRESDLTLED